MKRAFLAHLLFIVMLTVPFAAFAEQQPERTVGKMAVKLTRGMTNSVTSIAELPKQIVLTGEEMGPVGYAVVGPLKGIGMTLYRGFIGMVETVFFAVPQPGYYDPMMEPAYVWEGWESKRDTTQAVN